VAEQGNISQYQWFGDQPRIFTSACLATTLRNLSRETPKYADQ
jgi:hypothetical protein